MLLQVLSIENNTIGEMDADGIRLEDEPEIQFNMDEPMLSSSTTSSGGVSEKCFNNSSSVVPEKCLPAVVVSNKDSLHTDTNIPASNSNDSSCNNRNGKSKNIIYC